MENNKSADELAAMELEHRLAKTEHELILKDKQIDSLIDFTTKQHEKLKVELAHRDEEISQLKQENSRLRLALEKLQEFAEYRPTDARVNERIMIIHQALTPTQKVE